MKPFYPCIWCDGTAEKAAAFYTRIFPDSQILSTNPMVTFLQLNGQNLMLLNGGPMYQPTEGVSLVIECADQEEIDHYWNSLSEGGQESRCGWLKDPFSVSWQIIPANLGTWMSDPETAPRVGQELMKMNKIIISELVAAKNRVE